MNRIELLEALNKAKPGLSAKEIIEQSTSFVFKDNEIITYNDEVAVRVPFESELEGAVMANPLIQLLSKFGDAEIDITTENGEMRIKGKRRKGGVKMASEIVLPIDNIEKPDKWEKLHCEFMDAVKMVMKSTSKDQSRYILTCVHITDKLIEACDNIQITRYKLDTGMDNVLIPNTSLSSLVNYDMVEFSIGDNWIHFRDNEGVIYSTRLFKEKYPKLDDIAEFNGIETEFPAGLIEATQRAEIFSNTDAMNNTVVIDLAKDKMTLRGEGDYGWYEEEGVIDYTGKPVKFRVVPALLKTLLANTNICEISDFRMKITSDSFTHIICLTIIED